MFHKKEKNGRPIKESVEFTNGLQQKAVSENNQKGGKVKLIAFCVLGAAILYIALVMVQSSLINDYKQYEVTVFVPAIGIPANTQITEQNMQKLFLSVNRDSRTISEDYIRDLSELNGSYTVKKLEPLEIVCESGFQELDMTEGMVWPVEVSFQVSSFDQAVGGVLREGDCINLSVVKMEGYEEKEVIIQQIIEKTYVTRAFSSAGVELKREDNENVDTPATIINIYIPKAQEEAFNKAISEGTLRVSKVVE